MGRRQGGGKMKMSWYNNRNAERREMKKNGKDMKKTKKTRGR